MDIGSPTGSGSIVDFQYHNLIKEPYPLGLMGNWDVIFCRNVTIYFRLESTRRVVDNFYESLNPGGYLFIGHSETLTSISDRVRAGRGRRRVPVPQGPGPQTPTFSVRRGRASLQAQGSQAFEGRLGSR